MPLGTRQVRILLAQGHWVKLLSAKHVNAVVLRDKTDVINAQATKAPPRLPFVNSDVAPQAARDSFQNERQYVFNLLPNSYCDEEKQAFDQRFSKGVHS